MIMTIIVSIISGILSSGILTWYLQERIKAKNAKELESYINELRHKSELALKDYEAKVSERNIMLTEIFKYRREAIEIIYGKIVAINDGIRNYGLFLFANTAKQKFDILSEALLDLEKCYYPKSIYLEQESEESVHKFIRAAVFLKKIYTEIIELENTNPQTHRTLADSNDKLNNVPEMEAKVELALNKVIDSFRKSLGLQIYNTTKTP